MVRLPLEVVVVVVCWKHGVFSSITFSKHTNVLVDVPAYVSNQRRECVYWLAELMTKLACDENVK